MWPLIYLFKCVCLKVDIFLMGVPRGVVGVCCVVCMVWPISIFECWCVVGGVEWVVVCSN